MDVQKSMKFAKFMVLEKKVSYGKTVVKLAGQCVGTAHFSSSFVSTAYNKLHWTL